MCNIVVAVLPHSGIVVELGLNSNCVVPLATQEPFPPSILHLGLVTSPNSDGDQDDVAYLYNDDRHGVYGLHRMDTVVCSPHYRQVAEL